MRPATSASRQPDVVSAKNREPPLTSDVQLLPSSTSAWSGLHSHLRVLTFLTSTQPLCLPRRGFPKPPTRVSRKTSRSTDRRTLAWELERHMMSCYNQAQHVGRDNHDWLHTPGAKHGSVSTESLWPLSLIRCCTQARHRWTEAMSRRAGIRTSTYARRTTRHIAMALARRIQS